ncbi:MFS transporter [Pseudolysinimonas kribbensis]|nr:MFS transporter [Pseudolysinimonas kribbensis]
MAGTQSVTARLAPFVGLLVVLGLADSVTASFLVLYFTSGLGLSSIETGVATSASTLSGIALTLLAGRIVDRRVSRVPLVVALLIAAAGFIALAAASGFVPVLLGVLLAGASAVGFPQVFALERASATSPGSGMATGALRAGWSLAWALGPLAASVIVAAVGYRWLFIVGGILLGVGALVTVGLRLRRPSAAQNPDARPAVGGAASGASIRRPGTRLTIAAVAVFHLAMFVGSFALPLLLTGPAHADPVWVGVTFGVCAAVEVPAAFLGSRLIRNRGTSWILVACSLLFTLYFVVLAATPSIGVIVAAQLLRGVALAVTGVAGIEALRELMAPRVAAAAAAFANALAVGSLLAGIGAGTAVQLTGPRVTTAVAGGLTVVAAALLVGAARRRRRAAAPDAEVDVAAGECPSFARADGIPRLPSAVASRRPPP